MTMPERVQLRRTAGWRMPANTVSVARPTRWGNPMVVGTNATVTVDDPAGYQFDVAITAELAVVGFRDLMECRLWEPSDSQPEDKAYSDEWRQALEWLRGKNLACWCPLDQPCHADVLLDLANR
jgi:Domain of unknown function (DUF4326)